MHGGCRLPVVQLRARLPLCVRALLTVMRGLPDHAISQVQELRDTLTGLLHRCIIEGRPLPTPVQARIFCVLHLLCMKSNERDDSCSQGYSCLIKCSPCTSAFFHVHFSIHRKDALRTPGLVGISMQNRTRCTQHLDNTFSCGTYPAWRGCNSLAGKVYELPLFTCLCFERRLSQRQAHNLPRQRVPLVQSRPLLMMRRIRSLLLDLILPCQTQRYAEMASTLHKGPAKSEHVSSRLVLLMIGGQRGCDDSKRCQNSKLNSPCSRKGCAVLWHYTFTGV